MGLKEIAGTRRFVGAVVGVIGAAAGSGATYLFLYKRLEAKIGAQFEEELAQTKLHLQMRYKTEGYSDLNLLADNAPEVIEGVGEMRDAAREIIENAGYVSYDKVAAADEPVADKEAVDVRESIRRNIFDEPANEARDALDPDVEEENRRAGRPYVITQDEYLENATEYEQESLTYYDGDDTVASSEDDSVMEESDTFIGDENLVKFGQGARSNNVVHIRNDVYATDYEVTRSPHSYAEHVHGLRHSDDSDRPRRFRRFDD